MNSEFVLEEMVRVVVAMLGARRHYAVPRLLYEAGHLQRLYTDSYVGNKPWLTSVLGLVPEALQPAAMKRLLGRRDAILPPEMVCSYECLGLRYALARRRVRRESDRRRIFAEAAVRFGAKIGPRELSGADIVWGFDTASLDIFRTAKALGLRCVLEQTILPNRLTQQMLREQELRWPGWSLHRVADAVESHEPGSEREEQEWALADRIIVGSDFVRSGLVQLGVPKVKISVIPYGVDSARFSKIKADTKRRGKLHVLFVGEVGLRKGVPDLLHAFDSLPEDAVALKLVGGITLSEDKIRSWRDRVSFLGAVPRTEILPLYQWADVLVLPSIVEGSAAVTYEALMSGVPVIATPNSGSVVRDGVDGFIVPTCDPEALARALTRYLEDRSLLQGHKAATLQSRETAGLDRYRENLSTLATDVFHA